jgi:Na+/melibiose symporter-like transporter
MSLRLVAPLLGGFVFAQAGYNAVFEMTLGLIGIDILLRLVTIERKTALKWMPAAVPEFPAHPDEHVTAERANTEVHQITREDDAEYASPDGEPQLLVTFQRQSTLKATPALARSRRNVQVPAILTLLSSRRLLSALWGSLAVGAIFIGLEAVLPLQTQDVFGWDSIGAGLIFLPLTIPALLGPVVGWVCDRYGPRWPTFAGFLLACPVLTLLRLINQNTLNQKVLMCTLLTLVGCCFTLTIDPLMAEVAYVVEQKAKSDPETYGAGQAYAQAFALFNMAFSVGNTVGPLCAGLIRDAAGWGTMSWALGLLGGVTAISTSLWCGGWIGKQDARWRQGKGTSAETSNAP